MFSGDQVVGFVCCQAAKRPVDLFLRPKTNNPRDYNKLVKNALIRFGISKTGKKTFL